jgi:hypothetical protein
VLCAAFSPDGTELAVGDNNQAVYVWHLPRMANDLQGLGVTSKQG